MLLLVAIQAANGYFVDTGFVETCSAVEGCNADPGGLSRNRLTVHWDRLELDAQGREVGAVVGPAIRSERDLEHLSKPTLVALEIGGSGQANARSDPLDTAASKPAGTKEEFRLISRCCGALAH